MEILCYFFSLDCCQIFNIVTPFTILNRFPFLYPSTILVFVLYILSTVLSPGSCDSLMHRRVVGGHSLDLVHCLLYQWHAQG